MIAVDPPSGPPVQSIDEAIARMQAIAEALPANDGLACFNRMYLDVTEQVDHRVQQGFFTDPAFLTALDVVFANLYLDAVNAVSATPEAGPVAWQPLINARINPGIEPIQFALAGMNAHINHDLPLAVVATCTNLGTSPDAGSHHDDYQKVNELLDAAEQSIRLAFETSAELAVDRHVQAVADIVGNWSINAARDVAWDTATALWAVRNISLAREALLDGLARTVAMVSRGLLIAV